MDDAQLTIGEVARRAGVATSTVRFYEQGACSPPTPAVPDNVAIGSKHHSRPANGNVAAAS